jgi:hypothetical protein
MALAFELTRVDSPVTVYESSTTIFKCQETSGSPLAHGPAPAWMVGIQHPDTGSASKCAIFDPTTNSP